MRIEKFGLNRFTRQITSFFPLKNKTTIDYFTNGVL